MRPGEVTNDAQAFAQVLRRLEDDVGTIFQLIDLGKREKDLFPKTAPFWALVRMTFPVAESIGDLIYRQLSSVKNLRLVLENEFEGVRSGYAGRSAALALLYRHGLTHQDELQSLCTGGRELGWHLTYHREAAHLKLTHNPPSQWFLQFDTTAFYEDLVAVCRAALQKTWSGAVKDRYNSWLTCDLDVEEKNQGVKDAMSFMKGL